MRHDRFRIAVICGGPSPERGISLNSARSVMDHLGDEGIEIVPLYVDQQKRFWTISCGQLYSNTPADFDFKLQGQPLQDPREVLRLVDLVFPAIHGAFGEDGELQQMLEEWGIPFVGPSSRACRRMYYKDRAHQELAQAGFATWPQYKSADALEFFRTHREGIVKPICGGSSIGVRLVRRAEEVPPGCILEPIIKGREFTIVVIDGKALVPTEVDVEGLFDYRAKYLPTHNVFYHTPPRFGEEIVQRIRREAEQLFAYFKIDDFARFDGWVTDGGLLFTDFNPISGMEQNSFFFRQAAAMGMTHKEVLQRVVASACRRLHIDLPEGYVAHEEERLPVFVLFGGKTAERQVSLMSGTNAWLKLQRSKKYEPTAFFLDVEGYVWQLPYAVALNHTVEEILHHCQLQSLPKLTFREFTQLAQEMGAFVFLALHGGEGEDGTVQSYLDEHGLLYNGSCPKASRLGSDKLATARVIEALGHPDLQALRKTSLQEPLPDFPLIIKPRSDGCSAGVVVLHSREDLTRYMSLVGKPRIEPGTFRGQSSPIEMPMAGAQFFLEPYLEPDRIRIDQGKLSIEEKQGWVELTVAVVGGVAFSPSITVASEAVLSVEEKFQGGTGINITPPPEEVISRGEVEKIRRLVELCAKALHLHSYARIDLFYNRRTGKVVVLEANTLPALTPSTVLYHQGLAENPPLPPIQLLERLIDAKIVQPL